MYIGGKGSLKLEYSTTSVLAENECPKCQISAAGVHDSLYATSSCYLQVNAVYLIYYQGHGPLYIICAIKEKRGGH